MAADSSGSASDCQDKFSSYTLLDSTHLFVDFDSLDDLLQPIKNSGRIKYTCLAVCSEYIALGASTGSVYIFQKDNLKYLLQLTSNDGTISRLSFSRGCKRLAVVTGDSLITVWELNIEQRKVPVRILTSTTHKNEAITSLVWDDSGNRLFAGDVRGWVTITNIDSKKPSGLFKLLSELILKADSSIVQLDFLKNDLLVSTLTRCHICFTKRKKCATVGTKLRDGQFGACYWSKPANHDIGETLLLSARPGSRIWEASIQGEVQKTHQFKKLLAVPPVPVISSKKTTIYPSSDSPAAAQSLVFSQLHPIGDHFLLAVASSGLYVLNLTSVETVFWTNSIQDISSMAVIDKDVYCLHADQTLRKYTLCRVAHCAAKLFRRNLFQESLRVCLTFQKCIKSNSSRRHLPIQMMKDLIQKAKEGCEFEEIILRKFEETLADIEATFVETMSTASSQSGSIGSVECNSVRLESGIHVVVRRRNDSDNSVGDNQDETTFSGDLDGLESVKERSENQKGVGNGVDENDCPAGGAVQEGEGLDGEQRSQELPSEENLISVDKQKVTEVEDPVKDEKNLEVMHQSDLVAQEVDIQGECSSSTLSDRDTVESNSISKDENHGDLEEESEKISKGHLLPLIQSGVMNITVPIDTFQSVTCDEVKYSKDNKDKDQSSSNLSSNSKHIINSSSSTHSILCSSVDPNQIIHHSPGTDKEQSNFINSELDLSSSQKESVLLGDECDSEECNTDTKCHLNSGRDQEESWSSLRTYENDDSIPTNENNEINSDGIDHEVLDEVFLSRKQENMQVEVEPSEKEREARFDRYEVKVEKDHIQGGNGFGETMDRTLEDEDSLVIDGNKVIYSELGHGKDKNFEPVANIGDGVEIESFDGRDLLEKETEFDSGRKTETVLLEQQEPGEFSTSPSAVPPFLRKDSVSTVDEDAKLITAPARLTEKSKKLKKSRKAARIVNIGTVMGQNAKNTNISSKPPLKRTGSSPVPGSSLLLSPPVTSPSHKLSSPNSASPTRIPFSFQLSPVSQNGQDSTSPKHSPAVVTSIQQSDGNTEKVDKSDNVSRSADGLTNIGHSIKVVTKSLSQKLNKKSPLKRFKSVPSSFQPTQEDNILEVKLHFYSPQLKILEEATEMARFQLNDQTICNDPETKKATLTIWLKVLQDVLQTVVKQEKEIHMDNTSSPSPSNVLVEENISLKDTSGREGLCEVTRKSSVTSDNPHLYVNQKTSGLVRSQVFSPSAIVSALDSLGMEEKSYMDCCQFVMCCFQLEIFHALDEEKVEADRTDFEKELVNGKQSQTEPLEGELMVVHNSQLYTDSSLINGDVQFEEFSAQDAEGVPSPKHMTPPNQGGTPPNQGETPLNQGETPPNQEESLFSSTSGVKVAASSEGDDGSLLKSYSSLGFQKLTDAAEYSRRSQQEVSTVLDVKMEMERERDELASHFVWQYLPLLDTSKVRNVIDAWTVREETFRALLRAEEEISDDSVWIMLQDVSDNNIEDILKQVKVMVREKPTLAMSCLCRLQEITSVHFDMSDVLHQCYPNIRQWEALLICKSREDSNKCIVSYMMLQMNAIHEGSRDAVFQSEFQNMSVRRSLLSAALTYNCPDRRHLFCSICEVEPIPLSNRIAWPQQELIRRCINVCRPSENLQSMLKECYHHGYWLGVVELHKIKGQRQEGLDVVLKLTDPELLCEEKGLKPHSFAEWHQVLQFLDMYLTVLPSSPWQHLSKLCVNCQNKNMAKAGNSESSEELQRELTQGDVSVVLDSMKVDLSGQEKDFSNDAKCSPGVGQEEICFSEVDSCTSNDIQENHSPIIGNDAKHDNVEISESKTENSSKKTGRDLRNNEDVTQKVLRKSSSSSSSKECNRTEVSPEQQPRSQLTWKYVANLLVGSVGPAHALKVLQAYDIPQGALTHDFYLRCLQSASLEAKQKLSQSGERGKEENILTMHPLLKEHIESEITQDGLSVKETKRWMPISDKLGPSKNHWGRTIDLNSDCQLCGWSLQSFKTDVCMYACGHTYHSGCTSGDSCVICV